jgi:hypothetical protein
VAFWPVIVSKVESRHRFAPGGGFLLWRAPVHAEWFFGSNVTLSTDAGLSRG